MNDSPSNSLKSEIRLFLSSIGIGVFGMALSGYSLKNHLAVKATGSSGAICNINETFSCDAIANSPYSEVFGFPVAVFGLGFFGALIVLALLAMFQEKSKQESIAGLYALAVIGVLSSIGLGLVAWLGVGALCLSCIGVYISTILYFVLVFKWKAEVAPDLSLKSIFNGLSTAAIVVAFLLVGFNFFAPSKKGSGLTENSPDQKSSPATSLSNEVHNIVTSKSAYAGLGEDYRKGSDSAKVTVVEFSDFECPACGRAEPVLREVIESMGSKILFVFRNYPLDKACNGGVKHDMHKFACQAAVVGRCAGQFGKFWQFHDKSFAEQDKISLENIKSWGRDAGLTASQIDQCLASNDIMAKIKDDIAQGDLAGVTGTPAIFINGKKYAGGLSVSELNAAIESELTR